MGTVFSGIAAADDLDVLLTGDDFEPTVDVDTVALDATLEALTVAAVLTDRLEKLRVNLTAAGSAGEAGGLKIQVALTIEKLAGLIGSEIA